MFDRFQWLAAAVLVAALAGCGGEEPRDNEQPPPTDNMTTPAEGASTGASTDAGTSAGASTGASTDAGMSTGTSTDAGMSTGASTGMSSGMSTGASTDAGTSAGASTGMSSGMSTSASTGMSSGASTGMSTAAVSGPVMLQASWTPDKKVTVMSGADQVTMLDMSTSVNDMLVSYLKGKHDAGASKLTLAVPADMPFDQVGQPLMKAAFRAGFKASEVDYKPVTK